jgi:hypothetical protein
MTIIVGGLSWISSWDKFWIISWDTLYVNDHTHAHADDSAVTPDMKEAAQFETRPHFASIATREVAEIARDACPRQGHPPSH